MLSRVIDLRNRGYGSETVMRGRNLANNRFCVVMEQTHVCECCQSLIPKVVT